MEDHKFLGRVLLAEDDEAMRSLLADAMRERGLDVIEAGDGLEAIEKGFLDRPYLYRKKWFDLFVMDVLMPGVTGLEVLKLLRSVDSSISVILISAFADDDVCEQAQELGGSLIKKPFGIKEFLNEVQISVAQCH